MAKVYLQKLTSLLDELQLEPEADSTLVIKHFFSGAALYVNEAICASWSPGGLAFKLPGEEASDLIASGRAVPLRYFPRGHVKKDYALFENPDSEKPHYWKKYFQKAMMQV